MNLDAAFLRALRKAMSEQNMLSKAAAVMRKQHQQLKGQA